MIDVYVYNNSGSAKRTAKMHPESGLIRFEDGSYSHVSGESARGCMVQAIPLKADEPKPEVKVETPEPELKNDYISPKAELEFKIALLKEKAKRLTKEEKKELRALESELASLEAPKSDESES